MLSKLLGAGNKVELRAVEHTVGAETNTGQVEKKKTYRTEIYDILSEDRIEIVMPMEKTKLIALQVDGEYDMIFYTEPVLYQCFGRIIDRYKRENVYILLFEMTSNLRKLQRREYYRYGCALDVRTRLLDDEEIKAVEKNKNKFSSGLPLANCVAVDISGGGMKFVSSEKYEPESLIYCTYQLIINGKNKKYDLVGRIISSRELSNRPGSFEHRLQYVNMDEREREEIIKYIFEEERKERRREWNRRN
ncbi:MAG: flagellar brake protein [Lachnospiraceae bacterium]|nr:flagellar brake protein [Lachnospiraceae bacterium]